MTGNICVEGLQRVLKANMGELGVDGRTRNYYHPRRHHRIRLAGSDEKMGGEPGEQKQRAQEPADGRAGLQQR